MFRAQVSRVLVTVAVFAVTAGAVEYSRERYDVIVERAPFGEDTLALDAANTQASNAAETKAAERELRLCYLLEADSGEIRAGFQNKTARDGDPKSVMLMVGESFKGMRLLDIDLETSSATLDRNGTQVTFTLAKVAGATQAATAPKPATPPQRRFGGGFRRQKPTPQPVKQNPPQPAQPQLSAEEQAIRREEVRRNLQEYQMDVIREGMPPLPIPLSQEQDDQLVAEGVLPPIE